MNKEIMLQIVEEFKRMPKEVLDFDHWYLEENGKTTMCPIGWHIFNHPELIEKLNKNFYEAITISESTRLGKIRRSIMWVSGYDFAKYLDIQTYEYYYLFDDQCNVKDFFNNIEAFINGKIEIRECIADHCNCAFETTPDDKCEVCPDCKNYMLQLLDM
ncbi:MAG: hypothetical protein JSW11_00855 [Candidatus Heimdallarchaeota archaeon]|nr:MAG: hypothetical protein JSW11_00855 [Candidatus Heimdallarchaeota archaeon]